MARSRLEYTGWAALHDVSVRCRDPLLPIGPGNLADRSGIQYSNVGTERAMHTWQKRDWKQ
ncbi:MAG TPA: hypothetical protein VKB21_03790, partial [Candidatus Acidoferrum sp.]|nr:hypothetical protein [Candidatus Acidoferrum sp.]